MPTLGLINTISFISEFLQLTSTDMTEYESGTFRCKDCAEEFLTKEEADRHHADHHSNVVAGE